MEILILLGLILLNGVFAMSEIAIVTARKARLGKRANEGNRSAAIALKLGEDPTHFLSAVQIGITSIGLLNGIYGESLLAQPFSLWLQEWGLSPKSSGLIATVIVVVQRATRPVRALSHELQARPDDDLRPIAAPDAPRELQPLIAATNEHMRRQSDLLAQQQRFVRDASHQLRTPLAVLKAQVQSARRGDVAPPEALAEIEHTVDRATQLANQMLALAKVAQLQQQADVAPAQFDEVVRAVALDVAPLIAGKGLDFDLQTEPITLRAHDWMLRELTRNLLHNAIRHTPAGGLLAITLARAGGEARLTVADGGPGVAPELAERLFQPFSAGAGGTGSGLGLAICHEIVQTLGGRIQLVNRMHNGRVDGLDAIVTVPTE